MSKPVKDLITAEYQTRYGDVDSACVVSVVGLDAISTNRLRGELLSKNIRLQVVKNSLARRALVAKPLEPLSRALDGPCAIATGADSIIDVARTLKALKKAYPKLELKVGMIDGDPDLVEIEQLAKMKNLPELLGEIAMLVFSPARRLAGCLSGPGGRLAACLKAMADKKPDDN